MSTFSRGSAYGASDPVALLPCRSYEPADLESRLDEGFTALGGLDRWVRQGDRVLLKPNLLRAAPPEAAVTTHPAVVEAAIRLVRRVGGRPFVADSPSFGPFARLARLSGLGAVCELAGVPFFTFAERTIIRKDGGYFRQLEVCREVRYVDCIINLAKAKTHQQMLLTLGVKNLFGLVVGFDKARWHLRAGKDLRFFGRMLAELAVSAAADLTVLDAVVGMDGDGPGAGRPRNFGFLAVGRNPFAVDVLAAGILGIKPHLVPALQAGIDLGVAPGSAEEVEVLLESDWKALAVSDFLVPRARRADFRIPRPFLQLLRRLLTPRVRIDAGLCTLCGACIEACPPGVMSKSNGAVRIEQSGCISCYCCAEVCPNKAVRIG